MNNLCQCPFPYCGDISSIKFINKDKITSNCLRNHIITKELNEIKNYYTKKISENKNNNKFCICNEHNSKYIYFCYLCQINFCYFCKNKHNNHKYISIIEKIPSNKLVNNLQKFINLQKKEMDKINKLFNELIKYLKNQFDIMFNSLYDYLLCEETILLFSLDNINHINSIENIKYILDINFPQPYNKNNINYNVSQIKFNYEQLKNNINNKPMFTQIEGIYKYIGDIFLSSQKENNDKNENEYSFIVLYKKPFIENKKNLKNVNIKEHQKLVNSISKEMKYEMQQFKILNEHEDEIRNIISLNNGFFASSSKDCTFKIFNSLTGECILSMKEPYEDKICYILKLDTKNTSNEETNILLLSRHLIFIRFNNNYYYNHTDSDLDDNNKVEIIQLIDNNGIYISQGIQLSNSDIVTYNDNNEIKIYQLNPTTKSYLLFNYNINFKDIEFCSILEVKPNIFAASSNKKLEKGDNIIKFFDTNNKNIYVNDDDNLIIKNLNCSTGRDSLAMIHKNKILAIGLQNFENISEKNNFINGIALIDVDYYQIIQIIDEYRVHSMCVINMYINFNMLNKDNIFKIENFYIKRKILVTAGYDKEKETRLIKLFEVINDGDKKLKKNKFIDIINNNEFISEHEGFINSIKWLENGMIVTGSSDKMIFLYNFFN